MSSSRMLEQGRRTLERDGTLDPGSTAGTSEKSTERYPGSPDLKTIVSDTGESWLEFRKTLKPKYLIVWRDIALCYFMFVAALVALGTVNVELGSGIAFLAAPFAGLWIGYWLHSLACFGHEAVHYNVAPRHWLNDYLGNWLILLPFGLDLQAFRRSHWSHHLYLGSHQDTEISYHNHPSLRFLVELLTGIYALRLVLRYRAAAAKKPASAGTRSDSLSRGLLLALARSAVLHLGILTVTVLAEWYAVAVAWMLALMTYLAIGIIKQVLEHRSENAAPDIDYQIAIHGPVNRMFPVGFFSRTLGNAGFNRHMLHHWDPAISYTCFDEMEAFLMRTEIAPELNAARATYYGVLWQMLQRRKP